MWTLGGNGLKQHSAIQTSTTKLTFETQFKANSNFWK